MHSVGVENGVWMGGWCGNMSKLTTVITTARHQAKVLTCMNLVESYIQTQVLGHIINSALCEVHNRRHSHVPHTLECCQLVWNEQVLSLTLVAGLGS